PYEKGGISAAAAKYAQAVGDDEAVKWELENHGPTAPGIKEWYGHCDGWAASAVLATEPREARTLNGVTFTVGEQKALLAEIGSETTNETFGQRAFEDSGDLPRFKDVYPDQF